MANVPITYMFPNLDPNLNNNPNANGVPPPGDDADDATNDEVLNITPTATGTTASEEAFDEAQSLCPEPHQSSSSKRPRVSNSISSLNSRKSGESASGGDTGRKSKMRMTARDSYGPKEATRILKNLFVLGFSFILLFTAFMAMANLQSSINSESGLGVYSLATVYAGTLVAGLFLPPLIIAKLTCKWTLVVSITGYVTFIAAQFYPTFYTLLPASLYLGICAASLWAAKSAYVTQLGREYAFLKGQDPEAVLQRFFGIFFFCFHSSQVWGNVISSLVLSHNKDPQVTLLNSTASIFQDKSEDKHGVCGANFCPSGAPPPSSSNSSDGGPGNGVITRPSDDKIYTLVGIYVGCSLAAAIIIWLFVDSLVRFGELDNKNPKKQGNLSLLIATIRHWKKPKQLCVIPVSIWLGMQEAFIGSEFTAGFISCAWGLENIGYVMICFGICATLCSVIFGKLMEYTGRPPLFIMAALLDTACIFTMLHWEPSKESPATFFVISGLWGMADGIWSPQVKALYGGIFPKTPEAAFSNACLWVAVGFVIVYLNGSRLCMETKLYAYFGVLILAMIGYLAVEVIVRREARIKATFELEQNLTNKPKAEIKAIGPSIDGKAGP